MEVVLRILKGESIDKLSRELGLEIYILEEWQSKALEGRRNLKFHRVPPVGKEHGYFVLATQI